MRGVLADTGPLYALVDPDDRLHGRARQEAASLAATGLVALVAAPVLLEGYTLTLHRLGFAVATRWLEDVTAGGGLLNPTLDDYLSAGERLRRYPDQPISLTDAVLAELAERLSCPVWTFDHHFDALKVELWRPGDSR